MIAKNRVFLLTLIVLNSLVLLGQIWPEGMPPFARAVNAITMLGNLMFFASTLRSRYAGQQARAQQIGMQQYFDRVRMQQTGN